MRTIGAQCETVEAQPLLVVGGDVVTMDADRRVLLGATIAIADGVISAIGTAEELRRAHPGAAELDATGTVVIPGLINAHQHSTVDPLVRSMIPDNLPGNETIYGWIVPLHERADGDDDELCAVITAVDCLTRGVTTLLDPGTVAYPRRVAKGLRTAGIRARVGGWGWDDPQMPFSAPAAEVLAAQEQTIRDVAADGNGGLDELVTGWITLVGHGLVSDDLFSGALALAEQLDAHVTWHMSPGPEDPITYGERYGIRPIKHLERIGALGPRLLLGHAVWIDDDEIDALLANRVAIAACPGAYLRLGQGVTRAGRHAEFLRRGGRLALGCDAHNAGDVPDVLRSAWLLAALDRDRGTDDPIRAEEVFAVATVAGAEAIGAASGWGPGGSQASPAGIRSAGIGSLQPGLAADLVLLDTSAPGWIPRGEMARHLVWGAPADTVRDVIVGGRIVVREREVLTVDLKALAVEATERSASLLNRSGRSVPSAWQTVTLGSVGEPV
jgi:5-methylthioadenosine/S-adenosylhomocysteine deaminase